MADSTPASGNTDNSKTSKYQSTPKPFKGNSKTANGATRKDN